MIIRVLFAFSFSSISIFFVSSTSTLALPTPEDIPEEVLATEIMIEQRSFLDNQPLTVSEYTQETEEKSLSKFPADVDDQFKHQVFLLQIFKLIKTIAPI